MRERELIKRPFNFSRAPNDLFSENICSEDDLRSRIFDHLKHGIIAHF